MVITKDLNLRNPVRVAHTSCLLKISCEDEVEMFEITYNPYRNPLMLASWLVLVVDDKHL